jgi:hypothetical protein
MTPSRFSWPELAHPTRSAFTNSVRSNGLGARPKGRRSLDELGWGLLKRAGVSYKSRSSSAWKRGWSQSHG